MEAKLRHSKQTSSSGSDVETPASFVANDVIKHQTTAKGVAQLRETTGVQLKNNSSWSSLSSDCHCNSSDHETITCSARDQDVTSSTPARRTSLSRHKVSSINSFQRTSRTTLKPSLIRDTNGVKCSARDQRVDRNSRDVTQREGTCEEGSLKRFYHVFREGELDALIRTHVEGFEIVRSYCEHANWCVEALKIKAKT